MLRGVMADDLGLELGKNAAHVLVADIHVYERCAFRNVGTAAAAVLPERIEHENLVTGRQIRIHDVRSNEAGSAGDDYAHVFLSI